MPKKKSSSRKRFMKRYKNLLILFRQFFRLKDFQDKEVSEMIRPFARVGVLVVLGVLAVFVGWGCIAPIDSAAVAPGYVALESNRKTVQHLEGGIIDAILVKDGDTVEEGQPLVRLNDTAAKARLEVLIAQWRVAKAAEARLIAERDEKDEVTFPPSVLAHKDDKDIAKVIDNQTRLFQTRVQSLRGQVNVLEQQVLQYQKQIAGLESQRVSAAEQLKLTEEEAESVEKLYKQGYAPKPRLLALKRSEADLRGKQGDLLSQEASAQESITETKLKIYNIKNEYLKQVADEQKDTEQQVAELEEQIRAARDVLNRTVITAPRSGKVTGLKVHTVGGVISPGAPIMDIVPQNDKLIIEAQVATHDIDVVHEGLPAKVMLSAYRRRFAPRIAAKVTYVSADRFINEHTGAPYYMADVEVSPEALAKLSGRVKLYPGMPADVYIVTGEHTFISYIFSPILESFRKSLKEGNGDN